MKKRFPARALALAASVILCCAPSLKAAPFDWYRWRGPDLNGISKETGWQFEWPAEGPKQLWKASVGTGFSSMAVSEGRVYTMGNQNGKESVWCLDAETGKEIWRHTYDAPLDPNLYEGGPNATPAVDGKVVYTLSRKGHLFSFEAVTGKILWNKNVATELSAKLPEWGLSGSPLVEGDLVVLNAGTHGSAFDKKNGRLVWSTGKEATGFATPVPLDMGGQRCVAIFGAKALAALDVKTGRELWRFPWKTSYDINAADPIIAGDLIFVSSGYGTGGGLIRLTGGKPTAVWQNKNMHNQLNSSVLIKGHLYGISGQSGHGGDLRCVELATGTLKWKEPSAGLGSLMAADGKLIVLGEKGELIIAEADPTAFKPISRAQVLGGRCWTAPVLSNGRIFCRNAQGTLVCLDVLGATTSQTARSNL